MTCRRPRVPATAAHSSCVYAGFFLKSFYSYKNTSAAAASGVAADGTGSTCCSRWRQPLLSQQPCSSCLPAPRLPSQSGALQATGAEHSFPLPLPEAEEMLRGWPRVTTSQETFKAGEIRSCRPPDSLGMWAVRG